MTIIDLAQYRKDKKNILNRSVEAAGMQPSVLALTVEVAMRASEFPRGRCFHQNGHYVVILDVSWIERVMSKFSALLRLRRDGEKSIETFLKSKDTDCKSVLFLRRWPTKQQAEKILKKLL